MTIEEIANYVSTGSRSLVCVYRNRIENIKWFVISFYIMGRHESYTLSVEFDPINMVDDGEGWVWQSAPMELKELVTMLEKHLKSPLSDWENVTKSGRLSFGEEEIDIEEYDRQEAIFKNDLNCGKKLLPRGLIWLNQPD